MYFIILAILVQYQQKKIRTWQDSNLQSSDSKSDALSITLQVPYTKLNGDLSDKSDKYEVEKHYNYSSRGYFKSSIFKDVH